MMVAVAHAGTDCARGYCAALGASLLIAVTPVVVVFGAGVEIPFTPLVLGAYALQCTLILACALVGNLRLPVLWLLFALVYGIAQLVGLAAVSVAGGTLDSRDLVDACSKPIGVVLFAAFAAAAPCAASSIQRLLAAALKLAAVAVAVNLLLNSSGMLRVGAGGSAYTFQFASFFANRNQFGMFLFASIFVHMIWLTLFPRRPWNSVLLTLQVVSLGLTFSRASIGATGIMVLLFILVRAEKRPALFAFVPIAIVIGSLVTAGVLRDDRVQALFVRPEAGLAGRDEIWRMALDSWQEGNLFFGAGRFSAIAGAQDRGMEVSEFHGVVPETLAGGGLIELAIIVATCCAVITALTRSGAPPSTKTAVKSGFAGLLFLSFFESLSFFTIGWSGTLITTCFVSLPLLISRFQKDSMGRVAGYEGCSSLGPASNSIGGGEPIATTRPDDS